MDRQELDKVLAQHMLWLQGEQGGVKATLVEVDLRGANLIGTNLRGADLRGADLRGADLRGADLRGADLEGADLSWANLRGANLEGAYLRGANLEGANLEGANLKHTNLEGADLRGANLEGADLGGANLTGAGLVSTDIRNCKGDGVVIKNKGGLYWRVVYTKDVLAIGCKQHTYTEWVEFTDDEIVKMDTKALEFWQANKAMLLVLQTEFNYEDRF